MKNFSIHLTIITLLTLVSLSVLLSNQTQFDSLTQSFVQNIYLILFITITFISTLELITSKYGLPPLYWMTFIPVTLLRLLFIPLIIEFIPIYHIPFVGMILLLIIGSVLEMEYLRYYKSQTMFTQVLLISSIIVHVMTLVLWLTQTSSISFATMIIVGILTAPIILYGNILRKNILAPNTHHQIIITTLYSVAALLLFITSYLVILPAR